MDAAVAGLIGLAIGALSSLGAVWIQAHYPTRRARAKAVLDFAICRRSEAFEYADRIEGFLWEDLNLYSNLMVPTKIRVTSIILKNSMKNGSGYFD
ncbi:hypothetical protein [Pseudomonas sp. SCA2728.1_7]|uniref:hypothetical protein n=1 Tax=Pseudomonas sp. SCA2728.1_7 TaxID=2825975 RepID=UPI001BAEE26A|nr:hypothetical protein [Pseudomonas sp. SCA2728.1_7]QUE91223.1 hypothetical protein KBP52_01885 [Pseudomonas sp. SCA2728.1_7]